MRFRARNDRTLGVLRQKSGVAWRTFRLIWTIRPRAVVLYISGAILETAAFLVVVYGSAQLGAQLARYVQHGDTKSIWFWLWVDIVAGTATLIGFWCMDVASRLVYFKTTIWATQSWHATLCRMDIADFYDEEIRNQIQKVAGAYSWQLSNLSSSVLSLGYGLLRFMATAIVVAQITWWIIPLVGILLVPGLIAEARQAAVQWFVWDKKGDSRHIFWGIDYLMRNATSQMEIRSMQAGKYLHKLIHRLNGDFYSEQERSYARSNRLILPAKLLDSVATATGSIVLLRQFLGGLISLERYFFLSGALLRIAGSLQNIFGTLGRMQESILFVESYYALLDKQPRLTDKMGATAVPKNSRPRIEFRDVSFTYPGSDAPVFSGLNLVIEPGDHVAIVGENGAGKSTLIKLLMRFYQPTSGTILIDGIDLQDIQISSWYARMATLFQDFNRYPLSVRNNVMLGMPSSNESLETVAAMSGIDQVVAKLPYKWDTYLDNSFKKGTEPSGGQWQRVALARAFYRDAAVLVLDEPTAAIDANAEFLIFNSIFEHLEDRTALIVSHRFSTVRRADVIVVIDEGKIIEKGSHAELMTHGGLYYTMFTKQAEGYKD